VNGSSCSKIYNFNASDPTSLIYEDCCDIAPAPFSFDGKSHVSDSAILPAEGLTHKD